MPPVDVETLGSYGQFPTVIERDWLGRWCHLSEADVGLVRRRIDVVTQLGFAAQLVTIRATGRFFPIRVVYLSQSLNLWLVSSTFLIQEFLLVMQSSPFGGNIPARSAAGMAMPISLANRSMTGCCGGCTGKRGMTILARLCCSKQLTKKW